MTAGSSAAAQSAGEPRTDCVWSAAGGAVVGVGVAWYGYMGIEALSGDSVDDLQATPGNIALVLGLETAGLVGGAMVGCRLLGDEDRWYPTAGSVIVGSVLGGAALGTAGHALVKWRGIDADTDNPVRSSMLMLLAIVGGAAAGGYLGYRLDRYARGAPGEESAVRPLVFSIGGHF